MNEFLQKRKFGINLSDKILCFLVQIIKESRMRVFQVQFQESEVSRTRTFLVRAYPRYPTSPLQMNIVTH